jgi:hypothetical protein
VGWALSRRGGALLVAVLAAVASSLLLGVAGRNSAFADSPGSSSVGAGFVPVAGRALDTRAASRVG